MKKLVVGAALLVAAAMPLQAQGAGEPVTSGQASFYVGPYAGYMFFGDLFETNSNVEYQNDNGPLFGGQVGVSLSPNFSILGNIGYVRSHFEFSNIGGTQPRQSSDVGIWLYDANLQFRLPFLTGATGSWIAPFAQVGAGAIKWTPDVDDWNSAGDTNVQFNFGIGGDFQLAKAIGARIMVKDYITSLEWNDVGSVTWDNTFSKRTAHNWGLTVGLNFGF
jgi:hypothetical protein